MVYQIIVVSCNSIYYVFQTIRYAKLFTDPKFSQDKFPFYNNNDQQLKYIHVLFWFKILPKTGLEENNIQTTLSVIGTFLFYIRDSLIFIYFCYDPVFRRTFKMMPKLLWRKYWHKQDFDLKEIEKIIDQYENTS